MVLITSFQLKVLWNNPSIPLFLAHPHYATPVFSIKPAFIYINLYNN